MWANKVASDIFVKRDVSLKDDVGLLFNWLEDVPVHHLDVQVEESGRDLDGSLEQIDARRVERHVTVLLRRNKIEFRLLK